MENLNTSEEQSSAEMITEYASLLWRWAWLLILLAVLAGGSAYYLSRRQTPVYQASALAMINVATSSQDITTSLYLEQQLGASYSQIMTTRSVLDSVAQQLGGEILTGSVQVTQIPSTQLITVKATDTDPKRAASIANAIITVFSEQNQASQEARYADSKKSLQAQMDVLNQQIQTSSAALAVLGQDIQNNTTTLNTLLAADNTGKTQQELDKQTALIQQIQSTLQSKEIQQTQQQTTLQNYTTSYNLLLQSYNSISLAETQSSTGVLLKDPAVPPESPIQPQPFRSALLAAVVGLFLGAGIVFLIEFLDDSMRDPQEITRKWGIPILGMIINFNSKNGNDLITEKQPRAPVSEAFRSLRTNLQFASAASPIHTLLITSPSPSDGKTSIVGNLACVIAQGERKVVILDADLRRPRVEQLFQVQNKPGLTDQFIHPQEYPDGAVQPTEVKNLSVITSGSLPPNPSELLGSQRMDEIIQSLKAQFDLVIMDTPPALVVTDASVLAIHADGVLLVINPRVSKRAAIKYVIEQLVQVKAKIVGVVLNGVDVKKSRYGYYRGYYHKYGRGYDDYVDTESSGIKKQKFPKVSHQKANLKPGSKIPPDQQNNT